MAQVQVKCADVVKLILQFLKQNNLNQSFNTLQRESKTTLNTVNSNQFINAVMNNQWDQVLTILNTLMLTQSHLFNVYQLIVDDLIENDRYQAAEHVIKAFLNKNIRNTGLYRERMMRMQYIIENPQQKALHKKIVTQHRKKQVIKQCLLQVHQDVQSSRLMKLLAQAIKFQSAEGLIKPSIKLDLFQGKQKIVQQEQQTIIKTVEKVIKYEQDAKINSMALSWGEQYLALGGFDGLIEIYNTIDYTYHTGLKFQAEGVALFHDNPVTLLQFNHSDQMLASADTKGLVKIWNLQTGKLLRKIQMQNGISSVSWGIDASHICLAHQDIKLYGIRSCLVLKQYAINTAGNDYVNRVLISENRVFAVTNSGWLKIFNYSSQEELISTNLRLTVITVLPIYTGRAGNELAKVLVATPKRIFELSTSGQIDNRYEIEVGQLYNLSCKGEYIYQFIKTEDRGSKMNVVGRSNGRNLYYCSLQAQIELCCMQRGKNLMISYDGQHSLSFWRQKS